MLQIKSIRKRYITGDLTQNALNDVSFNLRDNEFVAVLGQSGSGKTTLLNIIGGLDRYDSGDIVVGDISTKKYSDRDWDSYRNHTIGFVFQSYNLIPHQSVLSNVELALTISGMSKGERRKRAKRALEQVGLGDQLHKRPAQMSGGQMQRVAIARALVNDPDILLADEPTGALDSETSVQVMELLKEVAKDRLVVMVTHNSDLAAEYANRIIRLHDGKIIDDTNPFTIENAALEIPKHKNMGKASMSFGTALSLSFNNLRTKKGRTILTAFAGSIGIIGIALILSISTGVNQYIEDIQKDTMGSYPIILSAQSFDLSSLVSAGQEARSGLVNHELDAVYSNARDLEMASQFTSSIKENNLTAFKDYLESEDNEITPYVGESGIVYSYKTKFSIFSYDPNGELINTDGSTFNTGSNQASSMMMGGMEDMFEIPGHFSEMIPGSDGAAVSSVVLDSYDKLYGEWPRNKDEIVLVLNRRNEISLSALYELGLLPAEEYRGILKKISAGETVELEDKNWSYADICQKSFILLPACDFYTEGKDGLFENAAGNNAALENRLESGLTLKITGVIRAKEGIDNPSITGTFGYTKALTDYIIAHTDESAVVKAQEASPDTNVLNGMTFAPESAADKLSDAREYMTRLGVSEKAKMFKDMAKLMSAAGGAGDTSGAGGTPNFDEMSEMELAAMFDQYLAEPEDETLLWIYNTYVSPGSYDDNMTAFGVVSLDAPSSISIYADNFENKDKISAGISAYNETAETENQITYTDYVGLLMSSVTTIVNVISYVLIAFVAVSLVVSSIMIGIITFISVLERTKEIGILRALGASKHNISQVFNAETFIVGLLAGVIGVGVTLLLLIPGNAIIHHVTGTTDVNAVLPWLGAVILIGLSMVLTLIAGLIPSKKAARKDPVIALRTE